MIVDPETAWDGEFPYDALGPIGITPSSSQGEVNDASFVLMTRRLLNAKTQKAWDELRDVNRRLVIDCLLYDLDLDMEVRRAREAVERALAEPGEPPEVAAGLIVTSELLEGLLDVGPHVRLAPPRPPVLPDVPPVTLILDLIEFDR
ncbi:hypothetical protein [Actinomycetospora chibensis]|uniref:Uncharacterized protein n=1 Tax=Actinomycetospora chibensis TaxID=663606 RepID=A0ABV9RHS1_9PSEU|nr:hypothetical protein [Actinomycetospora chibensis]MDD7927613.1 hypothetical protein [Actinomycetospora chibensis]